MTDHPDLTPGQEDEVRRLLAEARHTEPMPASVAERLDRVLAGLADEPGRERAVVRLAHRRRRAATMLVAAAAVVVAGVGVGQVLSGTGGQGEASSSGSEPAADSAGGGAREAAPSAGASATREVTAARVRPDRFAADVTRLRTRELSSALTAQRGADSQRYGFEGKDQDSVNGSRTTLCAPGGWGRGRYRPVRYGRATGYLVFRRPAGENQVVDLFLCGSDQVARSVTLPRR